MVKAPRNLRLAFVTTMNGAPWGGSEELWSQTALRLRERGHQVRASALHWSRVPERIQQLRAGGVRVTFRPQRRRWPGRMLYRLLRPVCPGPLELPEALWLRRQAPDLVMISQGGPWDGVPWMLQCHQLGLRYCAIAHANSEIWWPLDDDLPGIRLALQQASRMFFVSRANRDLMEKQCGLRFGNAQVVANPLNVQSRQEVPWPADEGVVNLACVGRLEPRAKGQDLLLQVLALPKWRERPMRLNLYGTGCGEQSLRALVSLLQLESVHFHGHVSDVNRIWAANHALILPSRYEGLPLVIVEAMLCGRPVITTDIAGNTELIQEGVNGFVAAAPAVPVLDEALERAWAARVRWREMGRSARSQALQSTPADPVGDFAQILLALAAPGQGESVEPAPQPSRTSRTDHEGVHHHCDSQSGGGLEADARVSARCHRP